MARKTKICEFEKGASARAVARRLRDQGATAVTFYLCGMEVKTPITLGSRLVALLTSQTKVRCSVERTTAAVFPRPYCHLSTDGLILNGQLLGRFAKSNLRMYREVWPELDKQLEARLGSFECRGDGK